MAEHDVTHLVDLLKRTHGRVAAQARAFERRGGAAERERARFVAAAERHLAFLFDLRAELEAQRSRGDR
jgi:hypothetical protein